MFQLCCIFQREIPCYFPILQKDYTIANGQYELIIMRNDNRCILISSDGINQITDIFHATIVQTAGRFIEYIDMIWNNLVLS